MGVSAVVAAAAVVGGLTVNEQRKQRKQAEQAAEQERQTIESLQREIQAEAAQPEAAMPVPDDANAKRAQRRSITSQMRRRGRQSTILTGNPTGDPLG